MDLHSPGSPDPPDDVLSISVELSDQRMFGSIPQDLWRGPAQFPTSLRRELQSLRWFYSCSSQWTPPHLQGFRLCRWLWCAPAGTVPGNAKKHQHKNHHYSNNGCENILMMLKLRWGIWRDEPTKSVQLTKLAASMIPSSTGWVQSSVNFRICFFFFPPCFLTTCFF